MNKLSSTDLPSVSSLPSLRRYLRDYASHGVWNAPQKYPSQADDYKNACRILGLLDNSDTLTDSGKALAKASRASARRILALAFVHSRVAQAWFALTGTNELGTLNPESAEDFISRSTNLFKPLRYLKARALQRWVQWLQDKDAHPSSNLRHGSDERTPIENTTYQLPLALITANPHEEVQAELWPDPRLFPHNEGGTSVAGVVVPDLNTPGPVLVVTGYASLDWVIGFLAKRSFDLPSDKVRMLFGWEVFESRRSAWGNPDEDLAQRVRDYWLSRGISVTLSHQLLKVKELMKTGKLEVRISKGSHPVHAKIYVTDRAVTLGSSNFTSQGFKTQSEGNSRFAPKERRRFSQSRKLAEGFWSCSADYKLEFLSLLESLLKPVTWQDALARGCAAILEGEWTKKYVPPELIDNLPVKLWPHQIAGITQALWVLANVGGVLVADATGSGKTRLGAWIIRAAIDRYYRINQRPPQSMLIVPPQVTEEWEKKLQETYFHIPIHSSGPLSNPKAERHALLAGSIPLVELLAVDEAHNYLNWSDRTRRIISHYADHVILLTATPINKGPSDLLALVELLGADNLPDTTLNALRKLKQGSWRRSSELSPSQITELREEIRRFTVRRTRTELNDIAAHHPEEYLLPTGESARYPDYKLSYYPCDCNEHDLEIAEKIADLSEQLKGVTRVRRLAIPDDWNSTEQHWLDLFLKSTRALARYLVMKCLRSSRPALYEHALGTHVAAERFRIGARGTYFKQANGNMIDRCTTLAGSLPQWSLSPDVLAEPWLRDTEAHREACLEEAGIYRQIAKLVGTMSPEREESKLRYLITQSAKHRQILAFDGHIITLKLFRQRLQEHGQEVELWTGAGGQAAKRRAGATMGLGAPRKKLIALCTDSMSEGLNLQAASCVVHLDTPTVIRTAEQRAGRVDRINSPHRKIEICWPDDPKPFKLQERDIFKNRLRIVRDLLGANLPHPGDLPKTVEELAERVRPDKREEQHTPDRIEIGDAFLGVRRLISGRNSLITNERYQEMKNSQADIFACESLVSSSTPWAFMVVGGLDREAPRWVFFDGVNRAPETDLARIAESLKQKLNTGTQSVPHSDLSQRILEDFVARLRQYEHKLLPTRKSRALDLLADVLSQWIERARSSGDQEHCIQLTRLKDRLFPSVERQKKSFPDPRSVATVWLRLIQPELKKALEVRKKRRNLWTLDKLRAPLIADPLDFSKLDKEFNRVPLLKPVDLRIIAMIIGIPTQ